MSRRLSTVVSMPPQSMGNGDVSQSLARLHAAPFKANMKIPSHSRHASYSVTSSVFLPNDAPGLDPDELFKNSTVAEVKLVQQRLRTDAEAKQEELRLMVGERYRDLLQASSSIISMAQSSKHVAATLEEAKDIIVAQDNSPLPKQVREENDTELYTLQLLSAHMKLLLDAPEHLWRLIEKRKYFSAAWLYLLARVVHHALVHDDEEGEEATWTKQGLDVLEQFPLVQRQWDAVSQFRAQIIHKATMSFREFEASAEDTCATLLTLYFLDSRPLTETLSVFLVQRTKALHAKLSWTLGSSASDLDQGKHITRKVNGHRPEDAKVVDNKPTEFRSAPVREVKQALLSALDVIFRTVKTSRDMFLVDHSTQSSMVNKALEYIQSDALDPTTTEALHVELQLTTQKLLSTLPSSAHFLLLPPNLKFYKPYVDLSSPSSRVPQAHLTQNLARWFSQSTENLNAAAWRWISNLQSVAEVWNVRSSILKWIKAASGFEELETLRIKSIFDDLCRDRLLSIWKTAFAGAESTFRAKLDSTISDIATGSVTRPVDTSPVEYLFQAPPLPSPSSASLGPVSGDASFQKYKSTLKRQLMGRTSLLDQVLVTLENCARTLQQDLSRVFAEEGDDTRILAEQFTEAYRPDAEALCLGIIKVLSSAATNLMNDSENTINSLVFVGGVAVELSSSPFVTNIDCGEIMAKHFQSETRSLHDRIVDRWRQQTVSRVIHEYWHASRLPFKTRLPEPRVPTEPSLHLIHSLLSLSSAIQHLCPHADPPRREDIAGQTLRSFITDLVNDGDDDALCRETCGVQLLADLAFLHRLAGHWGATMSNVCNMLTEKANHVHQTALPANSNSYENYLEKASDYLSRTQTLFATFLPPRRDTHAATNDKSTALLLYGLPSVDEQYQPAVQVAKPSSRFGLLLVEP